ncbi:MAG TPA: DNA translocase FtsK [Virgibacillus sp.]|nr:DNA translocase FtsK [Virgibacillus sp.]
MWSRIKKKIYDFFIVETVETIEEEPTDIPQERKDQRKQKFETRITYKYPEKTFRFPLIPDDDRSHDRRQERASDRNQENDQSQPQRHVQSDDPANISVRPFRHSHEKPFIPSRVASPIYGYQERKKNRELDRVPAYVRRKLQEEKDKREHIEHTFEEVVATTESSVSTPTPPTLKIDSDDVAKSVDDDKEVTIENWQKTKGGDQPVDRARSSEDHLHKTDEDQLLNEQQEIIETNNIYEQEEAVDKQNKKTARHKKQLLKKQRHRSPNNNQPVPYNVMMTPYDQKKWRESQLGQQGQQQEDKAEQIPYHLLNDPEQASSEDQQWVHEQQQLLEQTLKHFNVKAQVVQATQGPTVTRFEVKPDLGVKVSRVRNLSDDIKLNMAAKDIRIEAPIPGKNTIGIEVPNLNAQMVGLQEIFATDEFKQSDERLTIALGLNVEGEPLVTTISQMPHGLIAGATGSGKSVCINTILISLLYKESYEDLKLLLIDPKMVELAPYNGIPHLVSPVITDVKAATAALKWAVNEMEDRYEKFVQEGVRDIHRYNEKMNNEHRLDEKMPFMVIVIDELADLMMVSPQDVEDAICRIAQKARACGMHLLLATQRPSVDVITGLIKANIPTRIAFSVSSQVDSRTIIDTNGAEKLLGKGDMLFIENGSGKSVRLQGAFVSDEEIERVTQHVRNISPPNYLFEQEELLKQIEVDEEEDELLEEAIQFIFEQDSASTSMLQRQFRIGYNRAARLIDTLENKGIISGQNGSRPRDVLMTKTQLEELLE